MPVVLTDYTNKTWCAEQLTDGFLHVGYTGQAGPRLIDLLDFARTRQKQFSRFIQKQKAEERKQTNATNNERRLAKQSTSV